MTPFTESVFLETFKKYESYNIIALSFNSYRCKENYQVAAFIKKAYPGKFIIAGGVHPTVSSEEVIMNNNIDCICIGEGEFVLTEIVKKYRGLDFNLINNIYYKKNDEIQRNAINQNNIDFDEYPMPDYSIYDFEQLHCYKAKTKYLPVMLSRGCPFNCSFCSNYAVKNVSNVRKVKTLSPERAIKVIKSNLKIRKFLSITFDDDIVGVNSAIWENFFRLYKKEIALPFKCFVRPELVNEGIISSMKDADCYRAMLGVETGNESIRINMLNKKTKDKDFINCFNLLKKYNIDISTSNMIGIPGETINDSLETIKFNAKNKVDIAFRCILTPYRYTELYSYLERNKLLRSLDENDNQGFDNERSMIKLENYSDNQLQFVLASWNLLFLIYQFLFKKEWFLLINIFDFFLLKISFVYPIMVFLRNRFFVGKLTSFIYKDIEKKLEWRQCK